MTKKCEECGSYDLKADNIRGEVVCNDCGLVIEDQASATQNDNAGAMWGENASNTPTKDEAKIKTGSKGNALGSYIGKPNEAKGKWKILRHLHARDVKDLHPMAQATMGGEDMAENITVESCPFDTTVPSWVVDEIATGRDDLLVIYPNEVTRASSIQTILEKLFVIFMKVWRMVKKKDATNRSKRVGCWNLQIGECRTNSSDVVVLMQDVLAFKR